MGTGGGRKRDQRRQIAVLLENWGLRPDRLVPVKTVWRVMTTGGTYCLKPVDKRSAKVRFIAAAMEHVRRRGLARMAAWIPTVRGEPYVTVREDLHFMLTGWIAGVEPDYYDAVHLEAISQTLAEFHQASRGFRPPNEDHDRNRLGRWPDRLASRRQELLRFRREAASRSAPSAFDRLFLEHADWICDRAGRSCEALARSAYGRLVKEAAGVNPLCHGDVATRNFVFTPAGESYLIDFDFISIDLPITDVWRLLRRTLRHGWKIESARLMLRAYSSVSPLRPDELRVLAALLTFPDQAWASIHKRRGGPPGEEGSDSDRYDKLRQALSHIREMDACMGVFEEAFR